MSNEGPLASQSSGQANSEEGGQASNRGNLAVRALSNFWDHVMYSRMLTPLGLAIVGVYATLSVYFVPKEALAAAIPGSTLIVQLGLLTVFIVPLVILIERLGTKDARASFRRRFVRTRYLDLIILPMLLVSLVIHEVSSPTGDSIDVPDLVIAVVGTLAIAMVLGALFPYVVGKVDERLRFFPTILVIAYTVPIFAATSCVLAEHDIGVKLVTSESTTDGSTAEAAVETYDITGSCVSDLANFYLWNAADTVPILDIPERLNWTTDVAYADSDWVSGILVLLFLAFLIGPAIEYYRTRDDEDPEPIQQAEPPGP